LYNNGIQPFQYNDLYAVADPGAVTSETDIVFRLPRLFLPRGSTSYDLAGLRAPQYTYPQQRMRHSLESLTIAYNARELKDELLVKMSAARCRGWDVTVRVGRLRLPGDALSFSAIRDTPEALSLCLRTECLTVAKVQLDSDYSGSAAAVPMQNNFFLPRLFVSHSPSPCVLMCLYGRFCRLRVRFCQEHVYSRSAMRGT